LKVQHIVYYDHIYSSIKSMDLSKDLMLVLPHELLSSILDFLDVSSIFSLSATCKNYANCKMICERFNSNSLTTICLDTIINGHIDLFKWLVSPDKIKCSSDHETTIFVENAIMHRQLSILEYLCGNGCLLDKKQYCKNAVEYNHLKILKYLHEHECPFEETTLCLTAASAGSLEIIQYLREKGYVWNFYSNMDDVCHCAAEGGHLEVLKYLHENGCEWDKWSCREAAEHGHLEILKYLHENGCPWNEHVCFGACIGVNEHDQLKILQYLHENGCPWNYNSCEAAVEKGHLKILKYLHENGCSR